MEPTPLIPRRDLFGNPDRADPRVSPDATHLAWLAPRDGVLNVWVAPVEDLGAARPVTEDRGRGVRAYAWSADGRYLLHVQDADGDENWQLKATCPASLETRDLTPAGGVNCIIVHLSPRRPRQILVGLNDRDPEYFDVHLLDLDTGERTLVLENDRFVDFAAADDLELRAATEPTPEGGAVLYVRGADGAWSELGRVPQEDALTTGMVGVDADGEVLHLRESRGRDTAAWTVVDLATGESSLLAADPDADATGALRHPVSRHVEAVRFEYDRARWQILDTAVKDDLEFLRTVAEGDVNVTSRTLDDRLWVVAHVTPDGPVRYHLYEREQRRARFLFTNRSALEGRTLARMHAHILEASDGLRLVSYLSLPPWADPDGDGVPERPLPMVLVVHGGPWARDSFGYDPHHQWLANRGFAVLSVNYRGSTGFGKEFVNAADHQWAADMHRDLLDAVDWAVERGIADRGRVAVFGGSYGGYAALVSLTFTPEVFACAVDLVGPSNLETLLSSFPPYWAPVISQFTRRVGDPETEEGRALLRDRSPLHRVDRIRRPLLIAQGANDPRVTQQESDQIVAAMEEHGIPVTYLLYPDEGHGFARPENRASFYAVAEAFLAAHLGRDGDVRTEPVGDAFNGSSIRIPTGRGHVEGLADV